LAPSGSPLNRCAASTGNSWHRKMRCASSMLARISAPCDLPDYSFFRVWEKLVAHPDHCRLYLRFLQKIIGGSCCVCLRVEAHVQSVLEVKNNIVPTCHRLSQSPDAMSGVPSMPETYFTAPSAQWRQSVDWNAKSWNLGVNYFNVLHVFTAKFISEFPVSLCRRT